MKIFIESGITFITILFILIIIYSPIFLKKIGNTNINSIASTATSLGILGTFIGICLGLLFFDVSDIQGSVPELLSGLKTAFFTSITGMLVSLIVKNEKWDVYNLRKKSNGEVKSDNHILEMITVLNKIEKGISGDGETTLATQIQKLRTTNIDNLTTLNKSFNDFAEKVIAESSTSLIEALENVITDFNNKISEQFGENFKHLNEGVGKMLEWQKEYTERVELMTKHFKDTAQGIEKCEKSITLIIDKASVYQKSSEKLDLLLENLNTNLVSISEMSNKTKEIFPVIETNIKNLTENFSNNVNEAVRENNRMITSQKDSIDVQLNNITTSYQRLGDHQQKILKKLDGTLEKLMEDNATRITEQLTNLDKELSEELNKALTSLGSQLTSLSNKFVEDYEPLTKELQKLVSISKN